MTFQVNDEFEFQYAWNTGHDIRTGEPITVEDAMAVPDSPGYFRKTLSNVVKEAVEPLLVGTALLQRVNYEGYGQSITFPAVGALTAADIAEGQEYPEQKLPRGGATVTATIGKSGVAVKLTEEMVRYSMFDVMNLHIRAGGKALARHKEQKIFKMIRQMGVVAFDNVNPTASAFGPCTGRNLNGTPNGSVTMDDVFDAFAQVVMQGFMPDTLLMHPLTWTIFVKDPQLRAFVQANGGGVFFATWTGNPAGRAPWGDGSPDQKMGVSGGRNIVPGKTSSGDNAPHGLTASNINAFPAFLKMAPQMPNYMNVPMTIIVSPNVFFDPRRKLTDIYMFERGELGAYIVDEEITTEEFNDPARDLMKLKFRERYALAMFHEGQAVATIKNVHVVPNEVVLPAQTTLEVSSGWTAINPSTPLPL